MISRSNRTRVGLLGAAVVLAASCRAIVHTPEGTVWAKRAEVARRISEDLLVQGPAVRQQLRSSRDVPVVVVDLVKFPESHGADAVVTEKYILLHEGKSETLLEHELAHYYALKDPLGKLPFMVQEGLALLVAWDVTGPDARTLRLPSELAVHLALTATCDEALSWWLGSKLYSEVSLAAVWICATIGLEELQAMCASAPDDDPEWTVDALRERLPSLAHEPRRGSFDIDGF